MDRVLNLWEQHNRDVKTFECEFKRWVYDLVFARRAGRSSRSSSSWA